MTKLLPLLLLTGCLFRPVQIVSPMLVREQFSQFFMKDRPADIRRAFMSGVIVPGMTSPEVKALTYWSDQWRISRVSTMTKTTEQWVGVYHFPGANNSWVCSLVVENDIVVQVRECPRM